MLLRQLLLLSVASFLAWAKLGASSNVDHLVDNSLVTEASPESPCAKCVEGSLCWACRECVDTKEGELCHACWQEGCLAGSYGADSLDAPDCRRCWAAPLRCPAMCGVGTICYERCAKCEGGADRTECKACFTTELNDAIRERMSHTDHKLTSAHVVPNFQCLHVEPNFHEQDCSYCWHLHAPTRIEL